MIRCGAGLLHSCEFAEALDQHRFKVGSLITMDLGREPIANEEVLVEKSSGGVCVVWFLVVIARAYRVKWSVITSTFSMPPLDGSMVR